MTTAFKIYCYLSGHITYFECRNQSSSKILKIPVFSNAHNNHKPSTPSLKLFKIIAKTYHSNRNTYIYVLYPFRKPLNILRCHGMSYTCTYREVCLVL